MEPLDLIATARDLAGTPGGPLPRQTNLRRAVSTTYYALFHCLANNCADMLVGADASNRDEPAWEQTYRALQHGTAARRCDSQGIARFPGEIKFLAAKFVDMKTKRESADYAAESDLTPAEVIADINDSEAAISRFRQATARDRRGFAVYVLLPWRTA